MSILFVTLLSLSNDDLTLSMMLFLVIGWVNERVDLTSNYFEVSRFFELSRFFEVSKFFELFKFFEVFKSFLLDFGETDFSGYFSSRCSCLIGLTSIYAKIDSCLSVGDSTNLSFENGIKIKIYNLLYFSFIFRDSRFLFDRFFLISEKSYTAFFILVASYKNSSISLSFNSPT